ncbi:putative Zn-dependent protease [Rhodothalassium salexigens DSM 2132]|uniref:Putative Zn-dependent protease n=1 Tax=Rhodothalassium salexigens DSM 2132 TaxID=1188247 RepID=A0A4R2PQ15_RHOSA|nr:M48 family metalloprotease [Rhodothalassium salexigens]MBB4210571.1 putative Zn-dependent protease [Rhodothalassium salexigens DSM 2132]MBK1639983.1 hypothetical protein [Rhodothalassium salexigens DSM 2132]TCP37872.1 putative Zn-dependent protease [Rhodothalassium salexigens DSM 2132]
MIRRLCLLAVAALALVIQPVGRAALAQRLLRDAETEAFLHHISDPIFEAAGLSPQAVNIYLLDDTSVNAFVPGGQNIVVHAGLLLNLDTVGEVQGIMAHETGHITGSHIPRMGEGFSQSMGLQLLGVLLGAAAIAAGGGAAGAGLIMGGQSMAQRSFLSYRRVQESAADQAAVRFLNQAGISGRGLVSVFERFEQRDKALGAENFQYVITHPLSERRLDRITPLLKASEHWDTPAPEEDQRLFRRVQAKIYGFTYRPQATLAKYPPSDTSVAARYARVYAYDKALDWDKALAEIDSLIAEAPDDPYFHEMKGQMLYENGRIDDALPSLRRAANLRPHEPLLQTLLGRALVVKDTPEADTEAVTYLRRAAAMDQNDTLSRYNLAIIYTRRDQPGLANLVGAERAFITRNYAAALRQGQIAMRQLEEGTPNWVRAQDIVSASIGQIDPDKLRRVDGQGPRR